MYGAVIKPLRASRPAMGSVCFSCCLDSFELTVNRALEPTSSIIQRHPVYIARSS